MGTSPFGSLKLLQINLQRSKAAATEAIQVANSHQADLIAVKEPYCFNKKIALFGRFTVFNHINQLKNPLTGIILLNNRLDAQLLLHHTNSYFTTILMKHQNTSVVIISFYCPPSVDITNPLEELQSTIQQLNGLPVLVVGDFNAKSQVWHSSFEDPRGYKVVELMNSLSLQSLNTSTLPTYSSSTGERWMDISLANCLLTRQGIYCSTLDEHSASDHSYIVTCIHMSRVVKLLCIRQKTNWAKYQELIKTHWHIDPVVHIEDTTALELVIDKLQYLILSAYHSATTITTARQSAPWWTK
ncbi:uncharacterized protein LOC111640122 [Centruroides sculpturatus]|uniref:uncharacterized protein LOC111640122 n=1 Tax=Centruroides sculpturatus TaxID=218467 RepID=UPI000C6D383C|nr:uncharacterized protein LOC111640122 [Centruroides sculpturatus]